MERHITIPFGSAVWAYGLMITVLVIIIIVSLARRYPKEHNDLLTKWIGLVLVSMFLIFYAYTFYDGSFSTHTSLPFHLCALSNVAGYIALFTKSQNAFEFAVYLGIAGGLNSLITPEFAHGYDAFYHVHYYFEHGGIVLMPIFLGVAYDMKPRTWSWLYILIPVNALAVIMYLVNLLLDSNYMYVNVKPIADNPFLIGDWPYYIFMLELVLVVHTYVIYLCFHRFKRWV